MRYKMVYVFLLVLPCVAVASSHHHATKPGYYQFNYGVSDPYTKDHKHHQEEKNGHVVKGSYSFDEPDGTKRVVEYVAGPHKGFQAVVKRIGTAQHPVTYGKHNNNDKFYGKGHSPGYYGNGNSPNYYGNGNSPNYYGNGNSPNYYGNSNSPNYYGNGNSPNYYGRSQSPTSSGNRHSPDFYPKGYDHHGKHDPKNYDHKGKYNPKGYDQHGKYDIKGYDQYGKYDLKGYDHHGKYDPNHHDNHEKDNSKKTYGKLNDGTHTGNSHNSLHHGKHDEKHTESNHQPGYIRNPNNNDNLDIYFGNGPIVNSSYPGFYDHNLGVQVGYKVTQPGRNVSATLNTAPSRPGYYYHPGYGTYIPYDPGYNGQHGGNHGGHPGGQHGGNNHGGHNYGHGGSNHHHNKPHYPAIPPTNHGNHKGATSYVGTTYWGY